MGRCVSSSTLCVSLGGGVFGVPTLSCVALARPLPSVCLLCHDLGSQSSLFAQGVIGKAWHRMSVVFKHLLLSDYLYSSVFYNSEPHYLTWWPLATCSHQRSVSVPVTRPSPANINKKTGVPLMTSPWPHAELIPGLHKILIKIE